MRPVAAARRVLVVDDDATAADLLGRLLENAGFEVLLASTIAETKDILSRVPTDALILDRRLEDGDSLALLAGRHAWVAPGTEVVTMSASTGEEQEALDAGAVAHLRKPVAVEALLDQLRAGATHVPIAAGGHR
jgi:DNA-binding response OmpR family regulator